MLKRLLATPLAVVLAADPIFQFPDCQSGPLSSNSVCDASLTPKQRAQALVDAMTLDEKILNMIDTSPGVKRLGLPPYEWWSEALHGVAFSPGVNFSTGSEPFSYATSFPQPILLGAAFDDELIQDIATVTSTEARAFNNFNRSGLDYWTPNVNPFKDPRWGRGQETPGEDPFHIQSYVTNLIAGLQKGEDPDLFKVIATCKHFSGYDLEDNGANREQFDAQITLQELTEYYLPPFQTCSRDAKVQSFMCAYNAVNGIPACADSYMMQTVLREHWGWTGKQQYITGDCAAIQDIFVNHNYTDTAAQAVADALLAGADLDCGDFYDAHLGDAYEQGLYNMSDINRALRRRYASLVRTGYFDSPDSSPYRDYDWSYVSVPAAEDLALKAAESGMALLKNDGILPYDFQNGSKGTRIALIGSWANATIQMQGNYFGAAPYLHSPFWAAQRVPGAVATFDSGNNTASAVELANAADIVIIVDGIDNRTEKESHDRRTISWTDQQLDLFGQIADTGKPLVLAQMGGGQLDDSEVLKNDAFRAIIWGGYPGQDGGVALFNILRGVTSPAGRLPITQYPADYVNQVPMTDMNLRPNESSGNPGRTYKWYDDAVLPFGYGLHYTTFNLSAQGDLDGATFNIDDLLASDDCAGQQYKDLCSFATLPVSVANTGDSAASDFVLLAFIAGEFGPEPYPLKSLVAYDRVHDVAPGDSATAQLEVRLGSLGRRDADGNLVLYPGNYEMLLDVPTNATLKFTLEGDQQMLEEWPAPPPGRFN